MAATISGARAASVPQGAAGEGSGPAVAWGPIIAGAFAAAAISLILVAVGTGIGLASTSPWPNAGVSAKTFSIATAIWLIIIHWFASGFGGYLTGRMRRKWVGLHTHEVFFRDTAHGFLTWAVATVVATAVFASLSAAVVSGGMRAAENATESQANSSTVTAYFVDLLFRPSGPAGAKSLDAETRAETTRILATGLETGNIAAADRSYLAQLVASRTGLSQSEAQKRVDDVINQAREAADQARKASAALSLFTALAMVIGAFIAAAAGALGGSHRDEWSKYLATVPEPAD